MERIFLVHLAATAALFGLIWYVQIVHYPLYRSIGEAEFRAYHRRNTRITALVVLPLMLTEAATGAWLLYRATPEGRGMWLMLNVLLALNWASTILIQIPIHHLLEAGRDEKLVRRLLQTNWIRVVAWTLRTAWLVVFSETLK